MTIGKTRLNSFFYLFNFLYDLLTFYHQLDIFYVIELSIANWSIQLINTFDQCFVRHLSILYYLHQDSIEYETNK